MKKLIAFVFAASLAAAASLPQAKLTGTYMEARNADVYTGSCYANSEINLVGDLAVMGWKIDKGAFNGVSLDGLGIVGVIKASATLGDIANAPGPVKSILIVDEKASPAQREALMAFAKKMGGELFEHIVNVETRPISMTFDNNNIHSMKAKLSAGDLVSIETRPLQVSDQICRHEETYYAPLTPTKHAMAAYALANSFQGEGLGTKWSMPEKRSAFVANFEIL